MQRPTLQSQGIGEIAQQQKVSPGYVSRLANLALLEPDITQAIAAGDHPADLNASKLMQAMPLPMAWNEQHHALGMT